MKRIIIQMIMSVMVLPLLLAGREITCEGSYPQHLQDICRGDEGSIFWSFTNRLVKTDKSGQMLRAVAVPGHHGGLTIRNGLLYVCVTYVTDWAKGADYSEIFVYRPDDLVFVKKYSFSDAPCVDGIVNTPEGFAIGTEFYDKNADIKWVYQYTEDFKLISKHAIPTGKTYAGIQTIKATPDGYMLGCYDNRFVVVDKKFNFLKMYKFDAACGFLVQNGNSVLVARHFNVVKWKNYRARLQKVNLEHVQTITAKGAQ